ncbi:ent-copalyl diphosphate synthase 2-like [Dorcoceras hygrometricum]|uniref:Ent-copalyl diphosphate synthase 2-like n=1 Tax=Dorcoceras hygrometricum TaxID=472368 RepID=A0A2Z7D7D4_9LAMI|nr:ent-copalyl diphosphate synthase 2-like [Dorcoceras hygrometricum]
MTASYIQNTIQINFDSVLSLSDKGMVTMFKALESSGLRSFLGYYADIYEGDLENFFATALVRENSVISCVQGKFIEISEEQFAGVFELPSEGLTSVEAFPEDDKRSKEILFAFGEPIKTSFKKNHSCGLKINWSKFLFSILKDMVTPSSKQARGFTQSRSHQEMVFRAEMTFCKDIHIQKDALTQELTAFHLEKHRRSSILFVLNCLKSLPILIEGVMTKRGKRVVEVHSLKIEANLVVVEEAAANLQGKEVDLIEEEEAGVQDLVDGFLEKIFFCSILVQNSCT